MSCSCHVQPRLSSYPPPENHRNKPDRRLANWLLLLQICRFSCNRFPSTAVGWLCTTSFPEQFLHLTIWQQNMFLARIRAALSHPWARASMGGLGVKPEGIVVSYLPLIPRTSFIGQLCTYMVYISNTHTSLLAPITFSSLHLIEVCYVYDVSVQILTVFHTFYIFKQFT